MGTNINGCYIAFEFPLIKEKEIENSESGIKKKIYWQFEAFQEQGYQMVYCNPYLKDNILKRKIRRRLPLFFLTKWDDGAIFDHNLNFEYIRKPWHMDGDLIQHLKKIKKKNPNIRIILEVPTYPYNKETKTISSMPLIIKDVVWRSMLKKYVDRIVTYSNDEKIFGINTIRISNAISCQNLNIAKAKDFNPKKIHIMLCATLSYWHGYDRAITGLNEYYKNGGDINFTLHVVGQGEEFYNLQKMISAYSLDNHIIMHGNKTGKDLDELYNVCDLGFDSMGRHRAGVYYNSSLKGKEYIAKGLPVVSGVETELDYDDSFNYYMRVPADDSPINYFAIGKFCKNIYDGKSVKSIREEIRDYAIKNYSYKKTFEKVFEFIERKEDKNK